MVEFSQALLLGEVFPGKTSPYWLAWLAFRWLSEDHAHVTESPAEPVGLGLCQLCLGCAVEKSPTKTKV